MGKAKKRYWTSDEEAALLAGVNKYGTGNWKDILKDDHFAHRLTNRSNVDLKDKWRNLNCNASNSQSAPRKHTSTSYMSQMWRMVGLKRLCQIMTMILAILTMLGLGILQTQYWNKLPLMLTLRFLWLEGRYLMPTKLLQRWKDLKRFLKRLFRFYKWLQSFNENVKVHRMV